MYMYEMFAKVILSAVSVTDAQSSYVNSMPLIVLRNLYSSWKTKVDTEPEWQRL